MKKNSARSFLAILAVVLGFLVGPLALPAEAATCKVDGMNLSCTCDPATKIAGMLYRTTCNVIGKGQMSCIAYSASGPWTCERILSTGYTYVDGGRDCTFNVAGIGEGNGGGTARSHTYAYINGGSSCSSAWNRPAGSIAALIQLYRWNGSSAWDLCRDSGWSYSNATTWGWELSWNFGYTTPCGSGYYHTAGFGYQHNGVAWQGGYLTTNYMYLSGASPLSLTGDAEANMQAAPPSRPFASSDLRPPELPSKPQKGGPAVSSPAEVGLSARAAR